MDNQDANDDPYVLETELIEPMQPTLPKQTRAPRGVVACAVVTLFVVAAAVGSMGHAAYATYFDTDSRDVFIASASLISGLDMDVTICDDPWRHMCGVYDASHMSGSHIRDISIPQIKKALEAFRTTAAGPAYELYELCVTPNTRADPRGCETLYSANLTLAQLWRLGLAPNNIGVSRIPNPYRLGVRTVVFWDNRAVGDVDVYPMQFELHTDPCNLIELYRDVMCPDWATDLECSAPIFLVYGEVDRICDLWKNISANEGDIRAAAASDATYRCIAAFEQRLSPLACFERVAKYYPETNEPYLNGIADRDRSRREITTWFTKARAMVASRSAIFGQDVVDRIEAITLHAGWEPLNQPQPPLQLLDAARDLPLARVFYMYDQWAIETVLRSGTHTYPQWEMDSWSINAYYAPSENAVYIPDAMASLISPLESATTGTLLFVIAHEIGHAFDPSSPIVRNAAQSNTAYDTLEECLYSNYTTKKLTIGEDWADYIGMEVLAEHARAAVGPSIQLDDAEYTAAQQILLAFGQFWCASTANDPNPNALQDPHSLPHDRLVHAVSMFAPAFGYMCTRTSTCA